MCVCVLLSFYIYLWNLYQDNWYSLNKTCLLSGNVVDVSLSLLQTAIFLLPILYKKSFIFYFFGITQRKVFSSWFSWSIQCWCIETLLRGPTVVHNCVKIVLQNIIKASALLFSYYCIQLLIKCSVLFF